ncbi:MAG TPA: HAMP domain-containing histidine kinase, partial [Firmicutes bacterium]|nr:HAMP domain-containing histidine kinase [Bacillota bacterium]
VMFDDRWKNIELRLQETDDVTVEMDSDKMRQVFINILKNSADALSGRENGKMRIEIRKTGNDAAVSFRDNGPGVEQGSFQRIKQPFFTTKQKGSGLGLAISERIVKGHKGTMKIKSDGAAYTEVVITIPLSG